ncbi:hypothetical protein [Variovorax sp. OV700]|uniref:hypothetical protein n=1 Tax=Variovorax sp. OV700 TaxID=1882826 RepID=UPI00088DBAF3|nr:hypothetical protein [Variovorax sp. OV700]SDJ12619.1 hypothetical protein SAMN05444748_11052 [Variovorax sp. OV700]
MREDMDKVIVERPRRGGGVQGDGRKWRNSRERGSYLGMAQGYAYPKGLNENLAPLKRWLHKQVHRPWDKVYAELCSGIDRRSTVQAHIFQHIDDFVERQAVLRDGEVWVSESWWRAVARGRACRTVRASGNRHPAAQPAAAQGWASGGCEAQGGRGQR